MSATIQLPLITNQISSLAQQLEEASRLSGKPISSILDGLDEFVVTTMKHLPVLDRKFPERGYARAFESALSASVQREKISEREFLRGFFYHYFQMFHLRAYRSYPLLTAVEKCRSAYLPDSDVGPLLISNTDDPIRGFEPAPPFVAPKPVNVLMGGTGSGLHFDEEPEGFFPVDYGVMSQTISTIARSVPEAVEMLQALSPHWAGANLLLVDREKRSACVDKCSFNRFAATVNARPTAEHISGMCCQDAGYREYQCSQRQAYMDAVGGDWDGYESAFWTGAYRKDERLAAGLDQLAHKPTYKAFLALMRSHDKPGHLCKHGEPAGEGDPTPSFTLQRHAYLLDRNEYYRWQWDVERNIPTCCAPQESYRWQFFAE